MSELKIVLIRNDKLLLVDFNYPKDRNISGYRIVRLWGELGDIIKDIRTLLIKHVFECKDIPIGGFGSVNLFIANKSE